MLEALMGNRQLYYQNCVAAVHSVAERWAAWQANLVENLEDAGQYSGAEIYLSETPSVPQPIMSQSMRKGS